MGKGTLILGVVIVTSSIAFATTAATAGLSAKTIGRALGRACEVVGLAALFLLANVGVWSSVVLVARLFTQHSLSFYVLTDDSVLVLSGLQGLVFAYWLKPTQL